MNLSETQFTKYGLKTKLHKHSLSSDEVNEWSGMPSDDIDPRNKKGDWCR